MPRVSCDVFEPFSTMSVPIPRLSSDSPRFTFVPYDPLLPRLRVILPLRLGYNQVSVRCTLSGEMQRDIKVVFAVRSPRGDFEWSAGPPVERPHESAEIVCFEIPDPTQLYTIAAICVRRKGILYDWDEVVDDLILVPVPRQVPTQNQIRETCEERLSYLWTDDSDPEEAAVLAAETPRLIEFVSSMRPLATNDRFEGGLDKTMAHAKKIACIANTALKVRPSKALMNANSGFEWNRLIRKTEDRGYGGSEEVA